MKRFCMASYSVAFRVNKDAALLGAFFILKFKHKTQYCLSHIMYFGALVPSDRLSDRPERQRGDDIQQRGQVRFKPHPLTHDTLLPRWASCHRPLLQVVSLLHTQTKVPKIFIRGVQVCFFLNNSSTNVCGTKTFPMAASQWSHPMLPASRVLSVWSSPHRLLWFPHSPEPDRNAS